MVRVLVADDAAELFRAVVLQRGLARQIGDPDHPAESGFGAILPRRYQVVRAIEGTGQDLDPGAADAAEAQRRAAVGAEIALGDRGRFERGGLAMVQVKSACSMSANEANGAPDAFWHIRQ